jgi:hypothetical protein
VLDRRCKVKGVERFEAVLRAYSRGSIAHCRRDGQLAFAFYSAL